MGMIPRAAGASCRGGQMDPFRRRVKMECPRPIPPSAARLYGNGMSPIARIRSGISFLNANKKRFFWAWVAYQAVKGSITLSLIWIPLFLAWWHTR